jgi:amino acid transporter
VISVIYILTTFTFVLDVWWENGDLPQFYNQGISGLVGGATNPCLGLNATAAEQSPKYAAPILAVNEANFSGGVLVAFFIYSTLSAANTGLYVASRAVYGLARDIRIQDGSPWWVRMVAAPSLVEPRTKSPWWAVVISVLFLYWLPFIHLYDGYSMEEVSTLGRPDGPS